MTSPVVHASVTLSIDAGNGASGVLTGSERANSTEPMEMLTSSQAYA